MHFLKTKVDKTEWAVALFYEQFANSTDGIAFSMTLMHTEQDWKKLDIEKNPEKTYLQDLLSLRHYVGCFAIYILLLLPVQFVL